MRASFRPMYRRWDTVCRQFGRRCVSCALLAMYVVTAAGVPLPAGNLAKKSGEMFPCMDCSCGCNSAEQCWRACCCHTLAERMNWARERGVRPPEYAIDEARHEGIDLCWLDETSHSAAVTICCAAKTANGKPCCCSRHAGHNSRSDDTATSHVVVWRALACGGQSMNWLTAAPVLSVAPRRLVDRMPLVAWLGPPISACADGTAEEPVVPPPERA
jgi:hypothetical protein